MECTIGDEQMATKESAGRDTPCNIRVHSIRKRLADPDGISCKACLDGITKAGILRDDNAKIVQEISYSQEVGEDETIITIEFDPLPEKVK